MVKPHCLNILMLLQIFHYHEKYLQKNCLPRVQRGEGLTTPPSPLLNIFSLLNILSGMNEYNFEHNIGENSNFHPLHTHVHFLVKDYS